MNLLSGVTLCIGLISVIAVSGCGSKGPVRIPAPVSGKVLYKGKPLTKGMVTFQSETGAPGIGQIKSDGTYSLTAIVGSNTVMVVNREPDPGPLAPGPERAKLAAAKAKAEADQTVVPNEYSTPASPLKFEVKKGENKNVDFDIK